MSDGLKAEATEGLENGSWAGECIFRKPLSSTSPLGVIHEPKQNWSMTTWGQFSNWGYPPPPPDFPYPFTRISISRNKRPEMERWRLIPAKSKIPLRDCNQPTPPSLCFSSSEGILKLVTQPKSYDKMKRVARPPIQTAFFELAREPDRL